MSRPLYLEVPTRADRDSAIDPDGTDLDVHWRTGAWYRTRLSTRFTEIGGVLYAPFEPEADLLQLLAGHFSTRLGNEKWIIHDLGRGKAAIYAPRLWRIADFSLPEGIAPSRREEAFRDLWKEYFHSIAVRSRENPRLQRQFMPKKYWKHLPEKEPPAE